MNLWSLNSKCISCPILFSSFNQNFGCSNILDSSQILNFMKIVQQVQNCYVWTERHGSPNSSFFQLSDVNSPNINIYKVIYLFSYMNIAFQRKRYRLGWTYMDIWGWRYDKYIQKFIWKFWNERPFCRCRHTWEYNIKLDVSEISCDDSSCSGYTQFRLLWT